MATINLRAHCHCNNFDTTVTIPTSQLPLGSAFCSCSSCRYATGQLAASFAIIPIPAKDLGLDVSSLSSYDTSGSRCRYFCPVCGANIVDLANDRWRFCTGIIAENTDLTLQRSLTFVEDTGDGGIAPWLRDVGKAYVRGTDSEELKNFAIPLLQSTSADEVLTARCHCGQVDFDILPLKDGLRYHAGLDACTSCRLTTGFEITAWVSVDKKQISVKEGALPDGLQEYASSSGVFRSFCRKCGAAIWVAKTGQAWVDVATGLLRASEGARAERWLRWVELGFMEELADERLRRTLERHFKHRQ